MVLFIGKQFWKAKVCAALYLGISIIPYAFVMFLAISGRTGYDLLHVLSRFQFYLCFMWVCLTFYFVSGAERNYIREVTGTFPRHRFTYEDIALFWILVKFATWNLGMISILCIGSWCNDGSGYFLTWFWKSYSYNIIFPQLICIGLAYGVNLVKNQIGWFGFLLVFLFMASPFTENMEWRSNVSLVKQVWEGIRWPFSFFYQNGEWSLDIQYGLQTEMVRFYVFLFWIFLILAMAIKCHDGKSWISILFVCLGAAVIFCSFLPASLYRLNNSVISEDGMVYGEENLEITQEKADYKVNAYRLEVLLGNEMQVRGQMDIQSGTPRDEYVFTLYRGYHINKVKSVTEGVHVKFRQKDDELFVTTDCKVSQISVEIDYKGHHPIFYSNSEAAMLPGWFPWYPMIGKRQIYASAMGNNGYNPYNRIEQAECRLEVRKPIVSNLEEEEDGVYVGKADSITVLAGNIVETGRGDLVRDYLPLGLYRDTPAESYVSEQEKKFEQELDLLEKQCKVGLSEFKGKKILLTSKDLGRNRGNNCVAVFDSYILAVLEYLNADTLFQYLVLESCARYKVCQSSAIIQNSIHSLVLGRTSEDTMENYRQGVKKWSEFGAQYEVPREYLNVVEQYIGEGRAEEFIRGLAAYLLHPDRYEDDDSFIKEMAEQL